jgi:hypothetical protein
MQHALEHEIGVYIALKSLVICFARQLAVADILRPFPIGLPDVLRRGDPFISSVARSFLAVLTACDASLGPMTALTQRYCV